MRVTADIDEAVLDVARAIAADRGISLGAAISQLARQGMAHPRPQRERDGFPIFEVPEGAALITLDDVNEARDRQY